MKTFYVDMHVSFQEKLLALLNLVKPFAPYHMYDISPISHTYTDNEIRKVGRHEIVLNNRFSLNPFLVHFKLSPLSDSLPETLEELFSTGFVSHGNRYDNPKFHGKNYEEGVRVLFKELTTSYIFMWKPLPPHETRLNQTSVYKWYEFSKSFLLLGTMDWNDGGITEGLAWRSDKLATRKVS